MASEIVATDNDIDFCRNDEERQFLRNYRNADDAGKARAVKALMLGIAGKLPSAEEVKAMGPDKLRDWIDAAAPVHLPT